MKNLLLLTLLGPAIALTSGTTQAGVTIVPAPGFTITWDGNDGDHFDATPPADGAMAPDNLALNSNGGVAIGSAESQFVPTHAIAKLNDGFYGNSNSHINGPGVSPAWSGILLPATFEISSFAFGRDNGNGAFDDSFGGTDACGGQCNDRWGAGGIGLGGSPGDYILQYTSDGGGTWTDVATITYDAVGGDIAPGGEFTPWLRHEFEVKENGGPLVAGGLRLILPGAANNVAIDEFEIYGSAVAVAQLSPVEDGGVIDSDNLGVPGVPFAKDTVGGRSVGALNDQTFGDESAWIGSTGDNFVGLNLGALPRTIRSFAFGRDNTGVETDRSLGVFTVQLTDVAEPDETTADGDWVTVGEITYEAGNPQDPHLRHRFNIVEQAATGIRLLTPDGAAIDELEVYAERYTPPPPAAVRINEAPGFTVTWDGNDGDHFDENPPPAGATVPDNLALASNGGVPFGSADSQFVPTHQIANLNDGFYGNSSSHINGPGVSPAFFGIALPGPTALTAIAWGRDNGNGAFDDSFGGTDPCGGQCDDRSVGFYVLQFTDVADPDAQTGDEDWTTIAEFEYTGGLGTDNSPGGLFTEWLRHQYEIGVNGGGALVATGVRIVIPAPHPPNDIAIDEIELYGAGAAPERPRLEVARTPDGKITLTWDSKVGRIYNVRSVQDPSVGNPVTWPIYDGLENLEPTFPENSVSFAFPDDGERFFVVEEFPAPPEAVFTDHLDGGVDDWTMGSEGLAGTAWQHGSPSNVGPVMANSGANCFGTNLDAFYGVDANVWLRSPAIDLSGAAEATLCYQQYKAIENPNPDVFDFAQLAVLDAGSNEVLAVIETNITGFSDDWQKVTKALPAEALGKAVKIEWRLRSDDIENYEGWYIDDVEVTIP